MTSAPSIFYIAIQPYPVKADRKAPYIEETHLWGKYDCRTFTAFVNSRTWDEPPYVCLRIDRDSGTSTDVTRDVAERLASWSHGNHFYATSEWVDWFESFGIEDYHRSAA